MPYNVCITGVIGHYSLTVGTKLIGLYCFVMGLVKTMNVSDVKKDKGTCILQKKTNHVEPDQLVLYYINMETIIENSIFNLDLTYGILKMYPLMWVTF